MLLFLLLIVVKSSPRICDYRNALKRNAIWNNVVNKHGRKMAQHIFPNTYIMPNDLDRFMSESHGTQFIAKDLDSWARRGVFLYNNKHDVRVDSHKYALVQDYIKNPLLINGYKFATRMFVAVICGKGVYLYKDGYNVFTDSKFRYNSMDRACKINASFEKDRRFTERNLPRTFKDIGPVADAALKDLVPKLHTVVSSTPQLCCHEGERGSYNIFGIDMEILNDGKTIKILEINSKPALTFKVPWKTSMTKKIEKQIIENQMDDWIKIF